MTIMSKKTYASKATAEKAAANHERATGATHQLPSGRWVFWIEAQS